MTGARSFFWVMLPMSAPLRPILFAVRSNSIRASASNFVRTMFFQRTVFLMLMLIVVLCEWYGE